MKRGACYTVKKIYQNSNESFTIEWTDGMTTLYRLSDLQKRCPCAQCEEGNHRLVDPNVRATKIKSVGRYALRIDFTKGCSSGIYSYDFLRGLAKDGA